MDNSKESPEEDENEVVVDSDDSMNSPKNSPSGRPKIKKSSGSTYAKNTLKLGRVRRYSYLPRNIGSLNITTWVREEAEKDPNLYLSSSNFRREHSKRKIKENHYYQN